MAEMVGARELQSRASQAAAQDPALSHSFVRAANFLHNLGQRCIQAVAQLKRQHGANIHYPSVCVGAVGIVLSGTGYYFTESYYQTSAQQRFEGPASHYAAEAGSALQRYASVVDTLAAFFRTTPQLDRWKFYEFGQETLPRFPGLEALEWIPFVSRADRRTYEQKAWDDGLFGFRISNLDGSGNRVPALEAESYLPIYFVEPFEGNESRLGVDLSNSPAHLATLHQARDRGHMVATQIATSDGDSQLSRLLFTLPLFKGGTIPNTIKARRERLLGFARGVLDIESMIEGTRPGSQVGRALDLYLLNESEEIEPQLVYFHPGTPPTRQPLSFADLRDGLFTSTSLNIGEQTWSIVIRPADDGAASDQHMIPVAVAIISLLLTALLIQYLIGSRNRTGTVEMQIVERTAELSLANRALQTEIAKHRETARALCRAKEDAELANHAKTEFLAMVSHELRTPLNAIIGFSEVLSDQLLGPLGKETYVEYSRDIRSSGAHLLGLINQILDISQLESGNFALAEEATDAAELIHGVAETINHEAIAKNQAIAINLEPGKTHLLVDRAALRRALINIASNAVKFTPEGGEITFRVTTESTGGCEIAISDTGIGIAAADLPIVVEPFRQADRSVARKFEGAGLGLPLAKHLVELHGGQLEIDSTPGEGTTVRIRLQKSQVTRTADAA